MCYFKWGTLNKAAESWKSGNRKDHANKSKAEVRKR